MRARAPLPASPAQTLLEEVLTRLTRDYFGASSLDVGALAPIYRRRLTELCRSRGPRCPAERAYPLVEALVRALADPHTRYLRPEALTLPALPMPDARPLRVGLQSEPLGRSGQVVVDVWPGSAAERAGLRVGDVLLSLNGVPLNGAAGAQALARVFGRLDEGRLRYRRAAVPGSRELRLRPAPLTPALVWSRPRPNGMGPDAVAVLHLPSFASDGVAQAAAGVLARLQAAGVRGVVLDLRGNSGGRLNEMLLVAALFVPQTGVRLETRQGQQQLTVQSGVVQETQAQQRWGAARPTLERLETAPDRWGWQVPLSVLVDRDSASAAELLPLLLTRAGRARVAGETTFGLANTSTLMVPLSAGVLQLSSARTLDARGAPLPARVTPNLTARLDLNELARSGHDVAADAAAGLLTGLLAGPPPRRP